MAKKLRIAVWYNLPSGGGRRALYYHVRGLLERGHSVEAWRPPIPSGTFASLDELVKEHEVPLDVLGEGSNYLDRIVRHVARTRLLLKSMKEHCRRCGTEIGGGQWDVLFANTDMYFATPFISRYTSLPSALYLGEPHRPFYEAMPELLWVALPESVRRSLDWKSIKRRIRNHLDVVEFRVEAREELENARAFNKILVNSFYSRESVMRAYGLNSEVCYLGIDTEKFRDLGLPREPLVVGLGTLGPTKNVELAIKAIGVMKAPRPPLYWIGNMSDPVYLPQMEQLARELGVDFRPQVMATDEEVVRLLNRASAMIYAPRLEPFGLAPLEANACGLPVVAVAEGGVRETIVDRVNGRLVDHDPIAIALALEEMLARPKEARRMGKAAKEMVAERWSLKACVDRIEDALIRTAGR